MYSNFLLLYLSIWFELFILKWFIFIVYEIRFFVVPNYFTDTELGNNHIKKWKYLQRQTAIFVTAIIRVLSLIVVMKIVAGRGKYFHFLVYLSSLCYANSLCLNSL